MRCDGNGRELTAGALCSWVWVVTRASTTAPDISPSTYRAIHRYSSLYKLRRSVGKRYGTCKVWIFEKRRRKK